MSFLWQHKNHLFEIKSKLIKNTKAAGNCGMSLYTDMKCDWQAGRAWDTKKQKELNPTERRAAFHSFKSSIKEELMSYGANCTLGETLVVEALEGAVKEAPNLVFMSDRMNRRNGPLMTCDFITVLNKGLGPGTWVASPLTINHNYKGYDEQHMLQAGVWCPVPSAIHEDSEAVVAETQKPRGKQVTFPSERIKAGGGTLRHHSSSVFKKQPSGRRTKAPDWKMTNPPKKTKRAEGGDYAELMRILEEG